MIINQSSMRYLFAGPDLRDYLGPNSTKMRDEIEQYDKNALLNTTTEELASYFAEKYQVVAITLDEENITAVPSDTKIDISNDMRIHYIGVGRPIVDGTRITVTIPFNGDAAILNCNPNQLYPPLASVIRGRVNRQTIVLTHDTRSYDESTKAEIHSRIANIKERLNMMKEEIAGYNHDLTQQATSIIKARKEKLRKDHDLAASLGFKLQERDNIPQTYAIPEIKRKLDPPKPADKNAESLTPALAMSDFNSILKVVTNMVSVIERSPTAFADISEETLRFHFLVQLNGQYEGQATGETFNYNGKTDILIRYQNQNLFVGECKFWHGAEQFQDALKQLLGYATWRDGKLALLIFNRNKSLTAVLDQIKPLVEQNPQFVSFDSRESDTEFRFTMSHPDDIQKHLTLAVLVFEVPIKS